MGRPMGGEHEQSKAKAGPTKVARSSTPQPKPKPPHPRAQIISLLLRSRTYEIEAALATTGKTRPAALIRTAADVATTVRMIDLVTNANGADFDEIISDVVSTVLALGRLEAALGSHDLKGVQSDGQTTTGPPRRLRRSNSEAVRPQGPIPATGHREHDPFRIGGSHAVHTLVLAGSRSARTG